MPLVENGWVKGLAREPGRNANYRAGRTLRRAVGMHFTVGRCAGDRSIGLRGYFQFYLPRSPACGPGATQFAQIDAVCFHMCSPWNTLGWGVEAERLNWPEGLTEYQIDRWGLIVAASLELGIRDAFYDGPRVDYFEGFINHASARPRGCDAHSDGVTRAEQGQIRAAAARYLGSPTPGPAPTIIPTTRGRPVNHVQRGQDENVVFVADNGHLMQKAYNSGAKRWETTDLSAVPIPPGSNSQPALAAECKPDTLVDIDPNFQGNLHYFAKHRDGVSVVHVTYGASVGGFVVQKH